MNETLYFLGFVVLIVGFLLIDLLFVGKNSHEVSTKEAAIWSGVWISMALIFYGVIYMYGHLLHGIDSMDKLQEVTQKFAPHLKYQSSDFVTNLELYRSNLSTEFITGYLVEYTLSVDNIFVIILILTSFSVNIAHYKKVLFWGILGAIIMRFIFIFIGAALIHKFSWILLVFGAFLIYSGIKMFLERNNSEQIETQNHPVVKFLTKRFRVHPQYEDDKFFVRDSLGKKLMTPLFIVLVIVEFTDLVFATDSIPAIFAISTDPYIVFFSNIFAIIGLRSLFFLLIKVLDIFHFLKIGISFLLVFVGAKLLFHSYLDDIGYKSSYSLYIILLTFALSIGLSLLFPEKKKPENTTPSQN